MRDDPVPALDQAGLEALRKSVAHCTITDIATVKEGAEPELLNELAAYFYHFAKPSEGHKCLRCEEALNPSLVEQLLGRVGFEWGLVHGRGHCRRCGWPAAAHHFIKDKDGNDLMTIHNMVLQDHPDDIELRKQESTP